MALWLNWWACSRYRLTFTFQSLWLFLQLFELHLVVDYFSSAVADWSSDLIMDCDTSSRLPWMAFTLSKLFKSSYFRHIYWTVPFACTFRDAYFIIMMLHRAQIRTIPVFASDLELDLWLRLCVVQDNLGYTIRNR